MRAGNSVPPARRQTSMATARVLLVGLAMFVVTASSVAVAPAAGADCMGPAITPLTSPVGRGLTITVQGEGWGDSCYDTGPPPAGQGALGQPLTGIEVVITQGPTEVVVARGDADAKYTFTVDITVPDSLQPGPATVSARSPQSSAVPQPQPITISDQPAITAEQTVAAFGPNATSDPTDAVARATGEPVEQSSGNTNPWALPITVAIGMLAFVGIVTRRRRYRR